MLTDTTETATDQHKPGQSIHVRRKLPPGGGLGYGADSIVRIPGSRRSSMSFHGTVTGR